MTTTPATLPSTPLADIRSGERRCLNCGAAAPGMYCAACGQETNIQTPTVRQLVHEFVDQFIALENTLGRTLRTLALQPGELTLEYLRGRRQRYVRPFKLYLTVSVIFFSLVGFIPDFLKDGSKPGDDAADQHHKAVQLDVENELDSKPTDSTIEKNAKAFARKMTVLNGADKREAVRKQLSDDAPYAMFFLMPYFALLLRWFYRSSGRLYGEHLLFSVHMHTFAFLLLTLGIVPLDALHSVLNWGLVAYLFLALRHFYGGGWKLTLWRMGWLYLFYVIAIAMTAVSGVMAIVMGDS